MKTEVVAILLSNSAGHLLISKRPIGKVLGGLWEFPGGKMEVGESPEEALLRECEEELGLRADLRLCHHRTYREKNERGEFYLHFYWARLPEGAKVEAREGQELRWVSASDLPNYEFCPADTALVKALARGAQ